MTRSLARLAALRRLARGPWFPRGPGGEAGGLAGSATAPAGDVITVTVRRIDLRPIEAVIDALERLARAGRLAPRAVARLARACRLGGADAGVALVHGDADRHPAGQRAAAAGLRAAANLYVQTQGT